MSRNIDIFKRAEKYITNHDVRKSAEEIFIEFQTIIETHKLFEEYLKKEQLNNDLQNMKRNERLLAKRKLFIEWYLVKTQNKLPTKVVFINLTEFTFLTSRTIYKDLKKT